MFLCEGLDSIIPQLWAPFCWTKEEKPEQREHLFPQSCIRPAFVGGKGLLISSRQPRRRCEGFGSAPSPQAARFEPQRGQRAKSNPPFFFFFFSFFNLSFNFVGIRLFQSACRGLRDVAQQRQQRRTRGQASGRDRGVGGRSGEPHEMKETAVYK